MLRGGNGDGLTRDPDLTVIGPMRPSQDLHQGALTSAILSHQCQYFPGFEGEVYLLQRIDAGIALVDATHLEQRRGHAEGEPRLKPEGDRSWVSPSFPGDAGSWAPAVAGSERYALPAPESLPVP